MSEFKYACPVCGQHIKCDSSQAGTQMECPTCFQKIIVPQAPTDEQKFILTGQKVGNERPLPKAPDVGPILAPVKSFPGVAVVLLIFVFIAAAVGFVYRGTIFKSHSPSTPPPDTTAQNTPPPATNPAPVKKAAPLAVAPPSSDTNWLLNLKGVAIPEAPAAGRIEGQDFLLEHAYFTGGTLTLHDGDYYFGISFGGAAPETLAGKSINVASNALAAARISLRWKVGDQTMRESFTNDYAMMLKFNGITNNHIDGKIYLCTSDQRKSYVAGTFDAEIRKARPRNQ